MVVQSNPTRDVARHRRGNKDRLPVGGGKFPFWGSSKRNSIDSHEMLTPTERERAIESLVQLIKFPTISGSGPLDGSYNACAEWLLQELRGLGLETTILDSSVENKPIVIATWHGRNQLLPALLLNSHYDVVPGISFIHILNHLFAME